MSNEARLVGAAPNESWIRGTVVDLEKTDDGATWTVLVHEAESVRGLPNFGQRYIGKVLKIQVPSEVGDSISRDSRIAARISYEGDERGGAFYLVNLEFRKL